MRESNSTPNLDGMIAEQAALNQLNVSRIEVTYNELREAGLSVAQLALVEDYGNLSTRLMQGISDSRWIQALKASGIPEEVIIRIWETRAQIDRELNGEGFASNEVTE